MTLQTGVQLTECTQFISRKIPRTCQNAVPNRRNVPVRQKEQVFSFSVRSDDPANGRSTYGMYSIHQPENTPNVPKRCTKPEKCARSTKRTGLLLFRPLRMNRVCGALCQSTEQLKNRHSQAIHPGARNWRLRPCVKYLF